MTIAGEFLPELILRANVALTSKTDEAFDALSDAVVKLFSLETAVAPLSRLRPSRALRPALNTMSAAMQAASDELLTAMEAGNPRLAQIHGANLQPAMDDATRSMSDFSRVCDGWLRAQSGEDPLVVFMSIAADDAAGGRQVDGILDLARLGRDLAAKRLPSISFPLELGVSASLMSSFAKLFFDEEQFWSVVAWQVEHVRSNRVTLDKLSQTDTWLAHWTQASAQAIAACERLRVLSAAAKGDEASVYAALDFCHDLQEGLAKTVLATSRLLWKDNRDFEELLADGVKSLADWLRANGQLAAAVFELPSRNARAHRDWLVDGEDVVLCVLRPPSNGAVRISSEELDDHLIALAEVTLALHFGIVVAAASLLVVLPHNEHLIASQWRTYCAAILRGSGWSDADVSIEVDKAIHIRGRVSRRVSISELFSLVSYLPDTATTIEAEIATPNGDRRISIPIGPLRRFSTESDEMAKSLHYAACAYLSTIDGTSAMSRACFRKVVVVAMYRWVTEGDDEIGVVAAFKMGRAIATLCNDTELLAELRLAQGWRGSNLSGLKRDVDELKRFFEWMNAEVVTPDMSF